MIKDKQWLTGVIAVVSILKLELFDMGSQAFWYRWENIDLLNKQNFNDVRQLMIKKTFYYEYMDNTWLAVWNNKYWASKFWDQVVIQIFILFECASSEFI